MAGGRDRTRTCELLRVKQGMGFQSVCSRLAFSLFLNYEPVGPFQPQWWFSAKKTRSKKIINILFSMGCVRTSICT